ncbi:ABC transporter ATP-binding protein [Spirillospora sp. CA-255316]
MISIDGLRMEYGGSVALSRLDLEVAEGEMVALLGPSGCGKSTTLQLLAGFLKPTAGEIRFDGELMSSPTRLVAPESRDASLVFQNYAVWPHMTVAENVAFGPKVRKEPRSEIRERVTSILRLVQLEHLADRYPSELSGGQQQRVALARAIVVNPKILLLDEPLSNLDAALREEMRYEIRRVHERTGVTTVYVTHDQSEAMVCADRIIVLNRGLVEQVGTPREIYRTPQSTFVASFIGQANLLPASCAGVDEARVGSIKLRHVPAEPPDDIDVNFFFRPQDAQVTDEIPGDWNELTGTVRSVTYLGDFTDCIIRLDDDMDVRVRLHADTEVGHGDVVRLGVPVASCRLLPGRAHETSKSQGA